MPTTSFPSVILRAEQDFLFLQFVFMKLGGSSRLSAVRAGRGAFYVPTFDACRLFGSLNTLDFASRLSHQNSTNCLVVERQMRRTGTKLPAQFGICLMPGSPNWFAHVTGLMAVSVADASRSNDANSTIRAIAPAQPARVHAFLPACRSNQGYARPMWRLSGRKLTLCALVPDDRNALFFPHSQTRQDEKQALGLVDYAHQ